MAMPWNGAPKMLSAAQSGDYPTLSDTYDTTRQPMRAARHTTDVPGFDGVSEQHMELATRQGTQHITPRMTRHVSDLRTAFTQRHRHTQQQQQHRALCRRCRGMPRCPPPPQPQPQQLELPGSRRLKLRRLTRVHPPPSASELLPSLPSLLLLQLLSSSDSESSRAGSGTRTPE